MQVRKGKQGRRNGSGREVQSFGERRRDAESARGRKHWDRLAEGRTVCRSKVGTETALRKGGSIQPEMITGESGRQWREEPRRHGERAERRLWKTGEPGDKAGNAVELWRSHRKMKPAPQGVPLGRGRLFLCRYSASAPSETSSRWRFGLPGGMSMSVS